MITIYYSSSFKKSVKKHSSYKKQIKKRIEIFIKDPHNPSLKTHKLKGELAGYYSFSVNYSLRILFEFINSKEVGFVDIGTHEVYKK
jgi:addiction module RelE/StbE family toxin